MDRESPSKRVLVQVNTIPEITSNSNMKVHIHSGFSFQYLVWNYSSSKDNDLLEEFNPFDCIIRWNLQQSFSSRNPLSSTAATSCLYVLTEVNIIVSKTGQKESKNIQFDQRTGQPSTMIPLAVGQLAKRHPSGLLELLPHHVRPTSQYPRAKKINRVIKAVPASRPPEST